MYVLYCHIYKIYMTSFSTTSFSILEKIIPKTHLFENVLVNFVKTFALLDYVPY